MTQCRAAGRMKTNSKGQSESLRVILMTLIRSVFIKALLVKYFK